MIHYFTFGSDHSRHGTSLERCHVTVDAPDDHRAIFMGWRGSNAFSFEYDEHEWVAVKLGRVGHGIELKPSYWRTAVSNLRDLDERMGLPSLFDEAPA